MTRRDFLAATSGLAVAAALPALPPAGPDPLAGIPHDVYSFARDDTVRMFRCAWEDRHRLMEAILGRARVGEGEVYAYARSIEHPRKPGWYAVAVRIDRIASHVGRHVEVRTDGAWAFWSDARDDAALMVKYGRPEFISGMGG